MAEGCRGPTPGSARHNSKPPTTCNVQMMMMLVPRNGPSSMCKYNSFPPSSKSYFAVIAATLNATALSPTVSTSLSRRLCCSFSHNHEKQDILAQVSPESRHGDLGFYEAMPHKGTTVPC